MAQESASCELLGDVFFSQRFGRHKVAQQSAISFLRENPSDYELRGGFHF